jgi:hypothetical protein
MMFVCRLQVQMELINPVNDTFENHSMHSPKIDIHMFHLLAEPIGP